MKNHPKFLRFAFVVIVLASMLACNIPFIQVSIGNTPTAAIAVPPVLSTEPVVTEQPTNSGMAEMPPANVKSYDSGVITFAYDISVFMDVDAQTIPAVQPEGNNAPYFAVAPLHTELTLKGYVIPNNTPMPKMYIYPAAEFGAMLDSVQQDINTLKLIIANNSSNVQGDLPLLPPQNAEQVFHSNFKQLQFQNGAGIRFITMYAQALNPINNQNVFYTFQGITSDGKTYISIFLPVNNLILPADGTNPPGGDWTAFMNNFDTYLAGVVDQLNASPDDSFTPNLQLLDEMVQSIYLK